MKKLIFLLAYLNTVFVFGQTKSTTYALQSLYGDTLKVEINQVKIDLLLESRDRIYWQTNGAMGHWQGFEAIYLHPLNLEQGYFSFQRKDGVAMNWFIDAKNKSLRLECFDQNDRQVYFGKFIPKSVSANSKSIHGQVFDERNDPMIGVAVSYEYDDPQKGKISGGIVTNEGGRFELLVPKGCNEVSVGGYTGFVTKKISIENVGELNVQLQPFSMEAREQRKRLGKQ
jgi:hypothetical protein